MRAVFTATVFTVVMVFMTLQTAHGAVGGACTIVTEGSKQYMRTNVSTSDAYMSCYKASFFTFIVDGVEADLNEFCASDDCFDMYIELRQIGQLECLNFKNVASLELWNVKSAMGCFGDRAFSNVSSDSLSSLVQSSNKASANTEASETDSRTLVGIIGGSIGAGAVIATSVFVFLRRKRLQQQGLDPEKAPRTTKAEPSTEFLAMTANGGHTKTNSTLSIESRATTSGSTLSAGSTGSTLWDDEAINAVRIPFEKVEFGQLISRGGYGEVYRGQYRGDVVAIKTLLPERRKDMRQIENFLIEVKLMATLEHERIVRFVGVAWDSLNELCVVTEFLDRGDLRSVLAEFQRTGSHELGFGADKVKIALHVAHALTYMHSLQPAVLHRDLKSRNILLDNELNAKLTDFGVSRERADSTMTAGVGSSLWMAPEVMMGERYDEKADVFSFGVVLSELNTHELPYAHAVEAGTGRKLPDTAILQMVAMGRLQVEFVQADESEMVQLGQDCVNLDPAVRPTAAQVLYRVHQIWRSHQQL
ncbi:hypothetical protein Poli38472_012412 [Pythium oligandrum]|uniref:Protein kinase domain-containing protein n=1 Tax=Pythium oligandrum TaxID=41045 RepID=A0A8K1CP92_PYTOL|nr:hypothetical protein Poli38472_012412 [Pythium oligandrum]|eukprot:TMW67296.1 hypothetical protein Poli38472_012412 [Pythium oligandrum]